MPVSNRLMPKTTPLDTPSLLEQAQASRKERGELSLDEYILILEGMVRGDIIEQKQTSKGEVVYQEISVRDKLTAGKELTRMRKWSGAQARVKAPRKDVAALVRKELGI